jgi:ubiquinone/menaquinone biosynthesis C-methylase UbiE
MKGWLNLDFADLEGIDIRYDLENCRRHPIPLQDDSIDEFLLSHVIEHIKDPLALMQELHRIAKPGVRCTIRVPHGASDDAWEDPTHVRAYFPGSFGYFSQPYYWRADYGYRGDWLTEKILLLVHKADRQGLTTEQIMKAVNTSRNLVVEMVALLTAVKPARAPQRELQTTPAIEVATL